MTRPILGWFYLICKYNGKTVTTTTKLEVMWLNRFPLMERNTHVYRFRISSAVYPCIINNNKVI